MYSRVLRRGKQKRGGLGRLGLLPGLPNAAHGIAHEIAHELVGEGFPFNKPIEPNTGIKVCETSTDSAVSRVRSQRPIPKGKREECTTSGLLVGACALSLLCATLEE